MIKKNLIVLPVVLAVFLTAVPVGAVPTFSVATLTTPGVTKTLVLPEAADNSPVISLGTAVDPGTGELVQGFAIVHYKQGGGNAKGGSGGSPKPTACYGFLASGAKWKAVEPWVVNGTNLEGLDTTFVLDNLTNDIAKWEDATDGLMNSVQGADILGAGVLTDNVLVADTSSPDNVNEVYFGDVSSSGAIAVTIVWGVFGGPPQARKLVEWDMIFDEVDFNWSNSGASDKMDFENIATHELGHAVGLADLYNSACGEETMYGYGSNGETKKQTLNTGDIVGANKLY